MQNVGEFPGVWQNVAELSLKYVMDGRYISWNFVDEVGRKTSRKTSKKEKTSKIQKNNEK